MTLVETISFILFPRVSAYTLWNWQILPDIYVSKYSYLGTNFMSRAAVLCDVHWNKENE